MTHPSSSIRKFYLIAARATAAPVIAFLWLASQGCQPAKNTNVVTTALTERIAGPDTAVTEAAVKPVTLTAAAHNEEGSIDALDSVYVFDDSQSGIDIIASEVNTSSYKDVLIPLSTDGTVVAKRDSDGNIILPHPDNMSYRDKETGQISDYKFKELSEDGFWAIYGNHGHPDVKMLIKSKHFQYGAYINNPENPALVGVLYDSETNTVTITPLVYDADHRVEFFDDMVLDNGEIQPKLYYQQMRVVEGDQESLQWVLSTPYPSANTFSIIDDTTLYIDNKKAYSITSKVLKIWDAQDGRYKSVRDDNNREIQAYGFVDTDLGVVVVDKKMRL